jgi:murein DD-endopeptidase MepM/ murein hydrolase activator NlpD
MSSTRKSNHKHIYNFIRDKIEGYLKHKVNMDIIHCTAVCLILICVVGFSHWYVKTNIIDAFHVHVNGQKIGIVSDIKLIEQFKTIKKAEFSKKYPNVKAIIRTDLIEVSEHKEMNSKIENLKTIELLDKLITPKSFGVEIKVDDKVVAVVKDKQVAEQILDKLKKHYSSFDKNNKNVLKSLSEEGYYELEASGLSLKSVEFVQDIELVEVPISPEKVEDADEVFIRMQTGNVEPAKYTVMEGDCISCIAHKFDLTTEYIFRNNPWLKNDKLQIGDELDITWLQPTVSVKSVEEVIKSEEIRYATDYELNGDLRNGLVEMISPGKNGLKNVVYQITKVNGIVLEETVISEEIIEQPIQARAYRGTKIIIGQGSGRFSWPVTSPRISSAYGMRWGTFHRGIDITGNKTILAADNGKVVEAGYDNGGFGKMIIIDHMNGLKTLYGHLSQIGVKVGDIVEKNESIGVMGSTGYSTGVHLHFGIIENGTSVNPLKYLNY